MLLKKKSLQVVCLFHIVIVLTLLVAIFREVVSRDMRKIDYGSGGNLLQGAA